MIEFYKLTYVGVCGDSCGPLPCEECCDKLDGPTICKCDADEADDDEEPADVPEIVAVNTGRPGLYKSNIFFIINFFSLEKKKHIIQIKINRKNKTPRKNTIIFFIITNNHI